MSSFYITLPSSASRKLFPNNRSNNYHVRLPKQLFFPENDWEVGLTSVSFPDVQTGLTSDLLGDPPFCMSLVGKNKHYCITREQLMNDQPRVQDGVSLFNKIINFIDFSYSHELRPGIAWTDSKGRRNRPIFKWQERGGKLELLIDNTEVSDKGVVHIDISVELALTFHFIKASGTNDLGETIYDLDYGLRPEYIVTKPNTVNTIPNPSPDKFWTVNKPAPDDKYHKVRMLRLTCYNNWRMTHINENFEKNFGSPVKSLFVFCDANQTQVVGHQVTDKLREVVFNSHGRGRVFFEPTHIEFIPIRKNVIDDISVAITETNGKLVDFIGGNSIVTLKFERRINH